MSLDERAVRVERLETLQSQGINPYPSCVDRSHTILEILNTFEATQAQQTIITIVGRIRSRRLHGGSSFADIEDGTGRIQLFFDESKIGVDSYTQWSQLADTGDIVSATGKAFSTKRGQKTIGVESWKWLTKSIRPLPEKWHGLKDIEERFRHRYLDMLMNDDVRKRMILRSRMMGFIRNFFEQKQFLEVSTPTLQPIYGGGYAMPFKTHHNALDINLYLCISDEMYLKRLIVGGLERVYEIYKVFRNEGIDRDHNPEFTMLEAQAAYEDYHFGMDLFEELFEATALFLHGSTQLPYGDHIIDVKRPWKRLTMIEACKTIANIPVDTWTTYADALTTIKSLPIAESKKQEVERMTTVGECIAFIFEELVEEQLIQPTIVYNYPIEVSPLAKRCEDDQRFTQRFEVFINSFEVGNNYSELNDPIDLRQRFSAEQKKQERGFEEAHQTDEEYIEAIEHGFPPACGLGIGIDRMAMIMTNAQSIKEVIAFPTMKPKEKK